MPFNPFAGQPADTHRGRPRKKEPEPTQTEPEVPVEAPAETESSWEAAWGGTASVEPKPEPPMEADGPAGVPVEPEPPAETPAPAEASAKRETDMEPEPPVSTPVERDSPDAFAAAFARQDEPVDAFGSGRQGESEPDAPVERDSPAAFATAFGGSAPEEPVDAPAPEEPEPSDAFAAAFGGAEPVGAPEPDVPPEFAAAFTESGGSDLSNEPEDPAERARLERIGMETADPDENGDGFGDWRSMIGSMSEDGPAGLSGGWGPEEPLAQEPAGPEPTPPEPVHEPVEPSGGWGRSASDGWSTPSVDEDQPDDGWSRSGDMDEEEEEESADAGGNLIKPIAVIAACVLVIAMLGVGAFLLVRNIADGRARSVRDASCATYSRWVGEYNRAASDAKRLSVKVGAVDRQCPTSGADKAAKTVKAKAEKLSAEVAGAAKREWAKDKKTLAGLKDDYPSASADTLSDAKDLAGEDDPTDLADLNDMKARAKSLVGKAKKEQSAADAKEKAEREAKEKADAEAKAKQEAEQEAARRQAEAEEAARQQAAQQQAQQGQRTYTPQRQTYTPQRQTPTPAPTPTPAQPAAPSGNASQDF